MMHSTVLVVYTMPHLYGFLTVAALHCYSHNVTFNLRWLIKKKKRSITAM